MSAYQLIVVGLLPATFKFDKYGDDVGKCELVEFENGAGDRYGSHVCNSR